MSLQNIKNRLMMLIKWIINLPWINIALCYGVFVITLLVLGGAIGYLVEEMKNKESVDFIFLLIQISIALAGFTFLAELLDRGEKKNKLLLIRSSRLFLISAFLFFLCFFSLYYPQSEEEQELLGISIKNWNIPLFLFLGD